mgnify:CR=1 FL=1
MKIKELIYKALLKKEQGGALLDLLFFLILVILIIVGLSYLGISFSTVIDDIKKFFGFWILKGWL